MSKKKGGPPSKSLKKASDFEKEKIDDYKKIQTKENLFDAQEAEAETEVFSDFQNNGFFEQKTSVPVFQQQKSQSRFEQQYKKGPSKYK